MTDSPLDHVVMKNCVQISLSRSCDRDWVTAKLKNLEMNLLTSRSEVLDRQLQLQQQSLTPPFAVRKETDWDN